MVDAVDSGDVERLKAHIDFARQFGQTRGGNGITLEFRDRAGNTPLLRAAMQRNVQVVAYLLKIGANIDAVNNNGENAVLISYTYGQYNTTQFLLSKGAADTYHIASMLPKTVAKKQAVARHKTETTSTNGTIKMLAAGTAVAGAAGGAIYALSGGSDGPGSNSSGGSSTPTLTPADPGTVHPLSLVAADLNTAEAQYSASAIPMNSHYALARGYDGGIYERNADGTLIYNEASDYVKVAVVDSGVDLDHPDLAANILTADSYTCNNAGCVAGGQDAGQHGTWVAGLIAATKNSVGMQGIAPKAKIIAIGFGDPPTFGDTPGIEKALDKGAQIINGSYGLVGVAPPSATIGDIQALVGNVYGGTSLGAQIVRGVASHVIFVFAAGNAGDADPIVPASLPYYFQGAIAPAGISQVNYDTVNPLHRDWSENWVAAISVDSGNVISSFSNACGVAKNWCLAAPGEDVVSTLNGGGYTTDLDGTSFAAPNISGSLAVLLGAFPHLTPEEALQILFDTATDLGAAGIDDIYGHGLVNLRKATDPTEGGWSLTALGSMSAFSFNNSGFGLSAPFGNALARSHLQLQFLDGYRKNYSIPLSALSRSLTPRETPYEKFAAFAQDDFTNTVSLGEQSSIRFSTEADPKTADEPMPGTQAKFSYRSAIQTGDSLASFAFNYRTDPADMLGNERNRFLITDAFKDPYLNLLERGNSSVAGYASGNSRVQVAAYYGDLDREYDYRFDAQKSTSGMVTRYTYGSEASHVSLSGGVSMEENSLLGSETSGAFAIDKAATYHGKLAWQYALSKRLVFLGNYDLGLTKVSAARSSIFTGFNNVTSDAFALGMEYKGVMGADDRLGVVMSQPLRVRSGRAGMMLPVGMTSGGGVAYDKAALDLAPTGREINFETYYNIAYGQRSALGVNATYRIEPGNDAAADNEAIVFTKYLLAF